MQEFWSQITQVVGPHVPRLIAAAAILVVGWLVAMLIAGIVRTLLRRTTIDDPDAHTIPYGVAIAVGSVVAFFFPFSLWVTP